MGESVIGFWYATKSILVFLAANDREKFQIRFKIMTAEATTDRQTPAIL